MTDIARALILTRTETTTTDYNLDGTVQEVYRRTTTLYDISVATPVGRAGERKVAPDRVTIEIDNDGLYSARVSGRLVRANGTVGQSHHATAWYASTLDTAPEWLRELVARELAREEKP